jgi:hypothetical protein
MECDTRKLSYRFLLAVLFFLAELFLAVDFFLDDFFALFFAVDFFFAGMAHLLSRLVMTPCASGVDVPARSFRPTPHSVRRA